MIEIYDPEVPNGRDNPWKMDAMDGQVKCHQQLFLKIGKEVEELKNQ